MEVHAHTHTERKKFKHYLWEFLMLFLAVFCGFVAENLRETKVEQQRAIELARSLYKEIVADSIIVQQKIGYRNIKEKECAYFIDYVKDSSLITLSARFYPAFTWALIMIQEIIFEPNDGILNQLRNSGELRYFKSNELQSEIGQLSVMIANIRARNEKEYGFIELNLRPFSLRHYDFNWYQTFTQFGKLTLLNAQNQKTHVAITGRIINLDKFNRQEAENIASYYLLMLRGTRQIQYAGYANINHQLLQILRREYQIE